jgi:hypothetical protein
MYIRNIIGKMLTLWIYKVVTTQWNMDKKESQKRERVINNYKILTQIKTLFFIHQIKVSFNNNNFYWWWSYAKIDTLT